MIQFYGYGRCGTCIKAKKFLESRKIIYQDIDIIQKPPPKTLLKKILKEEGVPLKELFNRSGELYRSMKMKERLPGLTEDEALDLLARHGKLLKRPLVTDGKKHTVGFREELFAKIWRKP